MKFDKLSKVANYFEQLFIRNKSPRFIHWHITHCSVKYLIPHHGHLGYQYYGFLEQELTALPLR